MHCGLGFGLNDRGQLGGDTSYAFWDGQYWADNGEELPFVSLPENFVLHDVLTFGDSTGSSSTCGTHRISHLFSSTSYLYFYFVFNDLNFVGISYVD